jgi:hypothetical protein
MDGKPVPMRTEISSCWRRLVKFDSSTELLSSGIQVQKGDADLADAADSADCAMRIQLSLQEQKSGWFCSREESSRHRERFA